MKRFYRKSPKLKHAAIALDTAIKYKLPNLQRESLVSIENNANACFTSKLSTNISHESIEMILKSDCIDCKEDDVCKFLFRWITAQCTERSREPNRNNFRKSCWEPSAINQISCSRNEIFFK